VFRESPSLLLAYLLPLSSALFEGAPEPV